MKPPLPILALLASGSLLASTCPAAASTTSGLTVAPVSASSTPPATQPTPPSAPPPAPVPTPDPCPGCGMG